MTALASRRLGAVALGMLMVAFLSASDSPKLVFFASQARAEKDLKDFGRSNPSCELWSNWQKVCSRIGDTIYCGVDVTNRVRPSKTFCVGSWDGVDTLANMSQFRFCKKRGELYYSSSRRFAVCEEYLSGRPFDGRDLSARLSPACVEWRQEKTGARAEKFSKSGYYCAKFKQNNCSDYSEHFRNLQINTADSSGVVAGGNSTGLDHQAVYGTSCGSEK